MNKTKLCCIFNYAPLYRKSIYLSIDKEYDAQFCFSDMKSDIKKMDYTDFKKKPIIVYDRSFPLLYRFGILRLAFKNFKHFLVIGDANLSYLFFIPLCHLLGKKVYAWGHGYKSFKGKMGWYLKWLAKHFDVFFTYGDGGKQRMVELGIPSDKIEVIYNSLNVGVDASSQLTYMSNQIQEHFGNNANTLLFVGRLTKVKQLDWILKAQAYHKSKGINYNVLIIGDGPERQVLEQLVVDLGLTKSVWFYGQCYDDNELSRLLYNVTLCVSPGNVGLTALHAMSYGTPVISNDDFETQMPEYETIVPGKTGLLYKKNDFPDYCDKIEEWLALGLQREVVRKNCYDVINGHFNSRYQIELLKRIIQ